MAKTTLYSKDCPCGCDRRIEGKPCTDCCSQDQGTKSFFESHGFGECPNVGQPCPTGTGVPSCAGRVIGPITLKSDSFPSECLIKFKPVAYISYSADNFGLASGAKGKVGCASTSTVNCEICSKTGVITPFVESAGSGKSRMKITAFGQNAPHGGPYSLAVTAYFSLEPI